MWRSFHAPVGADSHRQSVRHLWFREGFWHFWSKPAERRHVDVSRQSELADSATKPAWVSALELALAFVVCAGSILAIFAWSGAGLQ